MNRFNGIVESEFAPGKKDMWLYKGSLKYFGPSGWTNVNSKNENTILHWGNIVDKPEFAKVAISGEYGDLINKPELYELEDRNLSIYNKYEDGTKVGINGTVKLTNKIYWGMYSYMTEHNQGHVEIAIGGSGPNPLWVRQYSGDPLKSKPQDATREAAIINPAGNTVFPGYVFSRGEVLVDTTDARLTDARPPSVIEITEGADLNTFITPGLYSCSKNNVAVSLANSPVLVAFSMIVNKTAHNSCSQLIISYNPTSPIFMYRTIYAIDSSKSQYGGWGTVYSTLNPVAAATTTSSGLMSALDKKRSDWHVGASEVTSLENIPVNKRVVTCRLSGVSPSISFSSTPEEGQEFIVYLLNATSTELILSVMLGSNSVYIGGNKVTIPAGEYRKVIFLYFRGTVFFVTVTA